MLFRISSVPRMVSPDSLNPIREQKKVTQSSFKKNDAAFKLSQAINTFADTQQLRLTAEANGDSITLFNLDDRTQKKLENTSVGDVSKRLEALKVSHLDLKSTAVIKFLLGEIELDSLMQTEYSLTQDHIQSYLSPLKIPPPPSSSPNIPIGAQKELDTTQTILDTLFANTAFSISDISALNGTSAAAKTLREFIKNPSVTLTPATSDDHLFNATYQGTTFPVSLEADQLVTAFTSLNLNPLDGSRANVANRQEKCASVFTNHKALVKDVMILTLLDGADILKDERNFSSDDNFMGYSVILPSQKGKRERTLSLSYLLQDKVIHIQYYDYEPNNLSKQTL